MDNGYCRNHQRFAKLNITKEELDDIRNGTNNTNIRLCKASGNNGQWIRVEDGFRTTVAQREKGKIKDKKRCGVDGSKIKWIENNPEKIAKYDLDNKARRIIREGEDYWINNAEQAKKWRENNADKMKEINDKKNNNPNARLYSMKQQAYIKGREWKLTDNEALELINNICHYCGEKNETSCNSIDRKDSEKHYTIDNCVPCCKMCNNMKNTLKYTEFLNIIEHICAFNKLHPNATLNNSIKNHISEKYNDYKSSAKSRNYDFELSGDDFIKITLNSCYICGKINKCDKYNNIIHRNGIDRYNNNIGYIKDNCMSCCMTCNYLKKNYDYDKFMQKNKKIYENLIFKNKEHDTINNSDNDSNNNSDNDSYDSDNNSNDSNNASDSNDYVNKLNLINRTKVQKSRQKKREQMGDELYKKMEAEARAKNRQKNNLCKENKLKKTKEQLAEERRIRTQKSRDKKRAQMGDENYRNEMAIKRALNRTKKQENEK